MSDNWWDKVCGHCSHSIPNKKHDNTIPSICICLNSEGDHCLKNRSWMDTCADFRYSTKYLEWRNKKICI